MEDLRQKKMFVPLIACLTLLVGCGVGYILAVVRGVSQVSGASSVSTAACVGLVAASTSLSAVSGTRPILRLGESEWTNPLIECDTPDRKELQRFLPLQEKVQARVQQEKNKGSVTQISMYFRALNSGRWMGIEEDEKYVSASLMKMPIMMTYLKLAETDPTLLKKQITYTGSFDMSGTQNIKPAKTIEKGKSYSAEELIRRMIVYSGNNSMILLLNQIEEKDVSELYQELDAPFEATAQNEFLISPRGYSIFFRALYNATYLTRAMSEKALKYLSEADFKAGLVAGVPTGTVVSHKFGERVSQAENGEVDTELHDCGIVYYPKHPYFLCVMTKGGDLTTLSTVIQGISKDVYSFMKMEYPQ